MQNGKSITFSINGKTLSMPVWPAEFSYMLDKALQAFAKTIRASLETTKTARRGLKFKSTTSYYGVKFVYLGKQKIVTMPKHEYICRGYTKPAEPETTITEQWQCLQCGDLTKSPDGHALAHAQKRLS